MGNLGYAQALSILQGWSGTPTQKYQQWQRTYDCVETPPPPDALSSDEKLAQWLADNYTGPPIPTG